MKRERLCSFGNCQSRDTVVTLANGDERPAFCSELHAALWLVARMKWKGPNATRNDAEQDELRSQAECALGEIARLREVPHA